MSIATLDEMLKALDCGDDTLDVRMQIILWDQQAIAIAAKLKAADDMAEVLRIGLQINVFTPGTLKMALDLYDNAGKDWT